MDLSYLPGLLIILILGVSLWVFFRNLKISAVLLLLLGFLLSKLNIYGIVFTIPIEVLAFASAFALIAVVFESFSNVAHADIDTYAEHAFKTTVILLILNTLFLSLVINLIFHTGIMLSLILSVILSGIDFLHQEKSKVSELLRHESVFTSPAVLLLPFLFLALLQLDSSQFFDLFAYLSPFLQKIIIGIGSGVFFGLLIFNFIKKINSETLAIILLVPSAILTYVVSEHLAGSGILAVAVLGIFFGKVRIHLKAELKSRSRVFSSFMEIMVFIPLGYLISGLSALLVLKALLIYLIAVILRFVGLSLSNLNEHLPRNDLLYLLFGGSKGISLGAVALMLSFTLSDDLINLILLFVIFSTVSSGISTFLYQKKNYL
ncbi:MAG: cation:proton antiporter [archaeon]